MGWFTGKSDSDDASRANTISTEEYRSIQRRALKANPKLAQALSDEATESRLRDRENYRNRRWN